jgi:hypothetical protein
MFCGEGTRQAISMDWLGAGWAKLNDTQSAETTGLQLAGHLAQQ